MKGVDLVGALVGVLLMFTVAISDELAGLEEIIGDRNAAVAAARRFDRQQQKMISWDRAMARDFFDQGQRELADTKTQDIRRRIALIEETWTFVLGYYPKDARVLNYYGEYLYDFAGKQDDAVQRWLIAIGLNQDLAAAHNNLGVHFSHSGELRKGLDHLHKAQELDSTNPDYLFNLAQIYLTYFPEVSRFRKLSLAKVYRDAMRFSKDAARYAPNDYVLLSDYAVNFYAAENLDVEADWPEAAKAWEAARAKATSKQQRFYTWLNEARVLGMADDWKRAEERTKEALRLRPDSESAQALLDRSRDELAER